MLRKRDDVENEGAIASDALGALLLRIKLLNERVKRGNYRMKSRISYYRLTCSPRR